jgi:hypothetical protein
VPTILRRLPFFEQPTTLHIPGGPAVAINHHQIIIWVSITPAGVRALPADARRFPAVLDTGFNDNFVIAEQQAVRWAGVVLEELPVLDVMRASGQRVPLRDADVWIHPNQPGERDHRAPRPPFRLELKTGIGVWPAGTPGARRLPLLSLRGLRRADLQVWIDCRTCHVWLRTPRRFWFVA